MSCYYIIAIRLDNRQHNAVEFQKAITKYGCNIKVRLGLHETGEDHCATDGLIILQPYGDKSIIDEMMEVFNSLQGVNAKLIVLE